MDDKDAIIRALQKQVHFLTARVADLERRLNLDSNSSKPPSSDGLSKKPRTESLREKGHPGRTLKMSTTPNLIVVQAVSYCGSCGLDLKAASPCRIEKRQVFDIPQPKVEIIEYQAECKHCNCGAITTAKFPEHVVAPVQFGPRIRAMAVYFNHQQLIPED